MFGRVPMAREEVHRELVVLALIIDLEGRGRGALQKEKAQS